MVEQLVLPQVCRQAGFKKGHDVLRQDTWEEIKSPRVCSNEEIWTSTDLGTRKNPQKRLPVPQVLFSSRLSILHTQQHKQWDL